MSQTPIQVPKKLPQRRVWLEFTAGVITFLVLLGIGIRRLQRDFDDPSHLTTKGQVLETRIAAKGTHDSQYGGSIFYQIEARVRYDFHGQSLERWMAASELTSRAPLQLRLADSPRTCEVYWAVDHPENARCRFYTQAK